MSTDSDFERMDPEDFLDKLRAGEFERGLVFRGMVKDDEEADDAIQFSHGQSCERWASVPTERIESIEVLTTVACDDHSHPFVELELKAPTTEEGEFFADVLGSLSPGPGSRRTPVGSMGAGGLGTGGPATVATEMRRQLGPGGRPRSQPSPALARRPTGGAAREMDCWDLCAMFRRVCRNLGGSVYDCEREHWDCVFDLCFDWPPDFGEVATT